MRIGFCRDMARNILKKMNIKKPPIDIKYVLEKKGFTYIEIDTFSDGLEALLVEQDGNKYAAVNKNHHETRKRFSLAHELGHLELNHNLSYYKEIPTIDNPPNVLFNVHKATQKLLENEANEFAGELLVPLHMLKKAYAERNDVEYLRKIFNVSKHVIIIRMEQHFNSLFK